MLLPQSFYNRPTLQIARDILGCFLIRKIGQKKFKFKIVEVEAYNGPNDLASHASRGRTKRNSVMFGEPGIIYVYFTYGMYYMLNIVTGKKEYPAAILIRALEPIYVIVEGAKRPIESRNSMAFGLKINVNGPARLTKALKIDKSFNSRPIYTKKYGLWIESSPTPSLKRSSRFAIVKTTRIGVDYAGKYKDKKWRFYIKGSKFISKK
ncbi:DNA-3-methyladenine glycosylase [Candidatus Falkowbacteria bacterium CG_4_9_14_3_um_filter_36_9]|uniref:Putative 3-methyladenine DNA glycosylase n=1 Tax=Candidatus Falkowbacteria bacterium CG02_land_8_20_14_3_00_36_14 TaxID=1974560 RepID=A0A2M7DKH1_9BACT|nr:MAG: DNA-3-methyladenine glycosylase [Candidatus Falkowbacteria bacterium CG02_land_8_20_14_3_00_36_14]PJA10466.1 MAG: DNA-3-methyladenine glycosylase [Candidatus Falkowbacteria bacterium CG_4_10_14_0_2_um_filter_36_22]PJB20734.1 MAG: DNA-3-methyladenine glycosylase [Candidatus Falkowbacteria bacterium CG_4_9_14_3_um_filter_36_9]